MRLSLLLMGALGLAFTACESTQSSAPEPKLKREEVKGAFKKPVDQASLYLRQSQGKDGQWAGSEELRLLHSLAIVTTHRSYWRDDGPWMRRHMAWVDQHTLTTTHPLQKRIGALILLKEGHDKGKELLGKRFEEAWIKGLEDASQDVMAGWLSGLQSKLGLETWPQPMNLQEDGEWLALGETILDAQGDSGAWNQDSAATAWSMVALSLIKKRLSI